MLCEQYKKDLREAAAGFKPAGGELRRHLQNCAECRVALASEEGLFRVIDANLRERANAEPANTLIPRVRAAISMESARQRRWTAVWVPVAASIALIAGVGVWNARRAGPVQHETQIIVSSERPSELNGQNVERDFPAASGPKLTRRNKVARRDSVTNIDFRPLVPAEQQAAVDRLIESIRRGRIDGKVLVEKVQENLEIPPMVIRPVVPDSPDADSGEPGANSRVPVSETWSDSNRRTK